MNRSAALFCAALVTVMAIGWPNRVLASDQRAVLTFKINNVAKSDVTVELRGDDVLVRRGDLDAAGIRGFDYHGAKEQDFIDLKSLAPDLAYRVDDQALTLELTVKVDHLPVSTFNYRPRTTLTLSKPARSAFLNYSIGLSPQWGAQVSSELGTRVGAGTFQNDLSFSGAGSGNAVVTRWIMDSPRANERLTLGDAQLSTGDLGASVQLFGATVERYFGLNPGVSQTVLPGIHGSVDSAATADVYVNGVLVRQEQLQPGQFYFQNLPIGSGPNNTQIVVTDAFGRQQAYSNYFYGADQLLAPGVTDFSYGIGLPRSLYGANAVGAGPTIAGRYTVGVTPNFTAGARLEANGSVASAGGESIMRLNRGVVGLELAASKDGSTQGTAGAISYQTIARHLNVSASLFAESRNYANLSLPATYDRPLMNATFSVSMPMDNGSSVGLSYIAQQDRDQGAQHQWQLSRWIPISRSMILELDANSANTAAGRRFSISTSLNFIPRHGASANFTASNSGGQQQMSASISKSMDAGTPAFGYNAGMTSSSSGLSGYTTGQYRWANGNYFGSVNFGGGTTQVFAQLAGGLVAIDGKVFATQPLGDSYALVDADGLANVRVEANGVQVGRTDRSGYALVPALGSYVDNKLSLVSGDVPLNYQIDTTEEHLVPQYDAGEVVQFDLKRVLPVFGTLSVLMKGAPVVPAFGLVEIQGLGTAAKSDLGENGEFYFEDLKPGTYGAHIQFKGGECSFQIHVPETQAKMLKLGTLTCANGVSI